MRSKYFKRFSGLILTALVSMLIAILVERVSSVIRVFEDLQSSFENYDFTDHFFKIQYNSYPYPPDTNIVFVNIGEYGRKEIAELISLVDKAKPSVIGLDLDFQSLKNDESDTLLRIAISESHNLVMSMKMDPYSETFRSTHPFIRQSTTEKFSDFIIEDNRTVRSFRPYLYDRERRFQHLGVALAEKIDPGKVEILDRRNREAEFIYYRFNINKSGTRGFRYFEYKDLIDTDFNASVFEDKIVIIGFLGDPEFPFSIESKHYSQLNEAPFKRIDPDMYHAVIIGNVVRMILDELYINSFRWLDVLLTISLLVGTCYLFALLYRNRFYQLWSKLLVFFLIIVFYILSFVVFEYTHLKIDLRYLYFFLLFAPDSYEILRKNVFSKIGLSVDS